MSLLLEALKKAEKAKQEGQTAAQPGAAKAPELGLEEMDASFSARPTPAPAGKTIANDRLAAAKMLLAKSPAGRNVKLLAGAGVILAVAGGAFYFWQETSRPGVTQSGAVRPAPVTLPAAPKPSPAIEPARPEPVAAASTLPAGAQPPAATATAAEAAPGVSAAPEEAAKEQAAARQTLRPSAKPEAPSAIKIQRGEAVAQLDPQLVSAFQAWSSGDYDTARQNYRNLLQKDPAHRDSLLGLAALAWQSGNHGEAASYYLRVLELDPRDAMAHAGLMAIKQGDPWQSESRLKLLLTTQPEAGFLHFALGNLYAGQSRWDEAQQAYFHAFGSDPANGDFAFNLAVSLDHLGQNRLAVEYYRRALTLATASSGFDRTLATQRIRELEQ